MGFAATILMASAIFISTDRRGNQPRPAVSLVGVIMDSKCAITGSHDPIMTQLGAKDARDCTLKCARSGSFELLDPETKAVYQLNDQRKPKRYAGKKVKISGPYDENSQTIEIDTIEPAS
jgi:hypothetical protein